MSVQKDTGSYYTPKELVQFMINYLNREGCSLDSVLESSAGDGRFLPLLLPISEKITAVEIFKEKAEQIEKNYGCDNLIIQCENFINFASDNTKKYSMIIGNPPYISLKTMKKEDIRNARKLCEKEGLSPSAMQNMWFAFVVSACRLLQPGGIIFFVLPMEFLQVQYAEKLREYLESKFNTIHIIVYQKKVFTDIDQEICLVYLTNKKDSSPYILYEIFHDTESVEPVKKNKIKKNKPLEKWSNAILSDEDMSLLNDISSCYLKVADMGKSAPGVVTGGNKYFILTEEQVERYMCREWVLPILQKSSFISDSTIRISQTVFDQLRREKKPVYLLNLSDSREADLPEELVDYLQCAGMEKVRGTELKNRFKCANRTPWYGVPIVAKGDVVFFKRYHKMPRLYINEMNIHTTDAGYHIQLKETVDRESFVFCFYNSMTLAQCEFNGRYYGGGVRELVPNEFKKVTVPYNKIAKREITHLNENLNPPAMLGRME